MGKQVLLIDMDQTICMWYAQIVRNVCNHKPSLGNYLVPESRLSQYAMDSMYEHRPELLMRIRDVVAEPGFYSSLEPYPNVVGTIFDLAVEYEIYFVSTLDKTNVVCADAKLRWVRRWLGHEFVKSVIFTDDKTAIKGDFLIDDKPTIYGAQDPSWVRIYFHQEYNKHKPGPRFREWRIRDVKAAIDAAEEQRLDTDEEISLRHIRSIISLINEGQDDPIFVTFVEERNDGK